MVDVEQDVRALVGVHVDVVALGLDSRLCRPARGRVVRAFLERFRGGILIFGFVVIRPDPTPHRRVDGGVNGTRVVKYYIQQ